LYRGWRHLLPGPPAGVLAAGLGNIAVNVLGNYNGVGASGLGNVAFSADGRFNNVAAGSGPFAIAGVTNESGISLTKVGPGFNINGFAVGGAAAVHRAATSQHSIKSAAAATHSTKATGASARSARR
jgi:hypothetical protein